MALVTLRLWMDILCQNARHDKNDLDIAERTIKGKIIQRNYDPLLIKFVVPINNIVEVTVAKEDTDIIKGVFSTAVILTPHDQWYQDFDRGKGGPLHLFYQTAAVAYSSAAYDHRNDKQQANWAMKRGLYFLEALRTYDQDEAENFQRHYEWLMELLDESK